MKLPRKHKVKIHGNFLKVNGQSFRLVDENGNVITSGLSNWLKRRKLGGYVPLILKIVKTGFFKKALYRWDLFETYKSHLETE